MIQIGIDTAKAISSLVAASQANALNAVTGGAAGVAQFATGIIQIATNIAKAKQILTSGGTPTSGGGGGTSSESTGGGSSVAQSVPQGAQLFGSANAGTGSITVRATNGAGNQKTYNPIGGSDSLNFIQLLDAGAQNGTSQAKTKRIFNISIRLYESIGVEVGPDLNNMEAIPFRSSANPMDQAIPVFTGDKEVEFSKNPSTMGSLVVKVVFQVDGVISC